MMMTMSLRTALAGQALVRIAEAIRNQFDRLLRYREQRRAIRTVSSMPDYLLRDIGIGRAQIVGLVKSGRTGPQD